MSSSVRVRNNLFRFRLCAGAAALVLCAVATSVPAQVAPTAGAQRASRMELAARVATVEQELASGKHQGSSQNRAKAEIAAIQQRLQQGDFKVGDRFVLTFRQDSVRTDTASVRDSLMVSLLALPEVSLAGVLRSELDDRLNGHVARFFKNASVRSSVLTRIAIRGAVQGPGFYYAAPDRPVSDLVMLAGGPLVTANLDQLEVRRGSVVLLKPKASKRVVKEGRTLEQIDIQSGDEVFIPAKRGRPSSQSIIQVLFVFSSLFFAFLQFVQWYYGRLDS
jgi:hypothetical protein